jgi:hypothetical protein
MARHRSAKARVLIVDDHEVSAHRGQTAARAHRLASHARAGEATKHEVAANCNAEREGSLFVVETECRATGGTLLRQLKSDEFLLRLRLTCYCAFLYWGDNCGPQ